MKISDIIYKGEYLFSDIDDETEFDVITTEITRANDKVLIIPNSLNIPKIIDEANPPIVTICDENAILPDNFPTIRVDNPRVALANAYFRFSGFIPHGMKIIGITGTNGKTSTAYFIKTILEKSGHKVGFIGTGKIEICGEVISDTYYSMTTPDPPLLYDVLRKMETVGCDTVVMEVSSHALALDKLYPITFDYGVFTNLSPEHMDFHLNIDDYFISKAKLFKKCKKAIINIDDEFGRRLFSILDINKSSVGILWQGSVWASNVENRGLEGLRYMYHTEKLSFQLSLKTAGIYNVYNTMLAATVCIDMGCKPCIVKQILGNIEFIPGRFEIIKDEISVIIDYAHTDSALNNLLRELNNAKGSGKLTVVFGCGGNRDKEKRPRMAAVTERYADRIIVTSDNSRNENPKDIIYDIIKGFTNGCYEVIENREKAISRAILGANTGDLIAIVGKGCESYNIDNKGYHDFNEKEIVTRLLENRKEQVKYEN